jgi:hypothetical protein
MTRTRTGLALAAVAVASVALGFVLTRSGTGSWDSVPHLERSRWLVHQYVHFRGAGPVGTPPPSLQLYGPLWATFLGALSEGPFRFVGDPSWVQHAFNFALYPVGLALLFLLLRQAGVARATASLAAAMLFGLIRLGGHAITNVNDFPFAMAYLLVALYLWNALRALHPIVERTQRFPRAALVRLGLVAAVPYLIRPPVMLHLAALLCFLGVYGRLVLPHERRERLAAVVIPLAAAAVFVLAAWPPLWTHGWSHWWQSFVEFARFPLIGRVRLYGHWEATDHIPWWYAFAWIPVVFNQVAFGVVLAGAARSAWGGPPCVPAFELPTRDGTLALSLRQWLLLFTLAAWLAVMVLRPNLYDEERHILFLYPPLTVLAALGLDGLGARTKYALAVGIAAASVVSYAGWGRYSYVYKSPLIPNRHASQFMGDYWALCVPVGMRALHGLVPPGAEVAVPEPFDLAQLQYARLTTGRWSAIPGYGPYRLVKQAPRSDDHYELLYYRLNFDRNALTDVRSGHAQIVWTATMPPGDPACVLVHYPAQTP